MVNCLCNNIIKQLLEKNDWTLAGGGMGGDGGQPSDYEDDDDEDGEEEELELAVGLEDVEGGLVIKEACDTGPSQDGEISAGYSFYRLLGLLNILYKHNKNGANYVTMPKPRAFSTQDDPSYFMLWDASKGEKLEDIKIQFNGEKSLKVCITEASAFIIIPISLRRVGGRHANILIIHRQTNNNYTAIRIEPHGWDEVPHPDYHTPTLDTKLEAELIRIFSSEPNPRRITYLKHLYSTSSDLHISCKLPFQKIAADYTYKCTDTCPHVPFGLCVTWIILITDLFLCFSKKPEYSDLDSLVLFANVCEEITSFSENLDLNLFELGVSYNQTLVRNIKKLFYNIGEGVITTRFTRGREYFVKFFNKVDIIKKQKKSEYLWWEALHKLKYWTNIGEYGLSNFPKMTGATMKRKRKKMRKRVMKTKKKHKKKTKRKKTKRKKTRRNGVK